MIRRTGYKWSFDTEEDRQTFQTVVELLGFNVDDHNLEKHTTTLYGTFSVDLEVSEFLINSGIPVEVGIV